MTAPQLAAHAKVGPFWLDIMDRESGNWRYVVRAAKDGTGMPGVWVCEVNRHLRGAEDIANGVVAALNAAYTQESTK